MSGLAQQWGYQRKKDYFPAPEAQWPVEASIVLKDQNLFEIALGSSKSLHMFSISKTVGKAMFFFNLPTTHAKYVSDKIPQDSTYKVTDI